MSSLLGNFILSFLMLIPTSSPNPMREFRNLNVRSDKWTTLRRATLFNWKIDDDDTLKKK